MDDLDLVLVTLEEVDDHLDATINDPSSNVTQQLSARLLRDNVLAATKIVMGWKYVLESGWKCCERCGLPTPTASLNWTNTRDDRRMCPRCCAWVVEDEERQRDTPPRELRTGRGTPRRRRPTDASNR